MLTDLRKCWIINEDVKVRVLLQLIDCENRVIRLNNCWCWALIWWK